MWIKSQMLVTPQYPTTAFTGQTVIVTGSNTGLGFEAARHFVRLGAARVILAVRSIEKGNAAREDIERSQPGPIKEGAVVEVWELDLSRYASVVAFGERCVRELDRLDVVVENAAKLTHTFSRAEGAGNRESTIAVNVVSTMLLALFLLPKLRETAVRFGKECVLTFTGSFTHFMTGFAERHATGPGKTPIFDGLDVEEKANMKERFVRLGHVFPTLRHHQASDACMAELTIPHTKKDTSSRS